MRFIHGCILLMLIFTAGIYAGIQDKDVEYESGDVKLKGYIIYEDEAEEKLPGILVVH